MLYSGDNIRHILLLLDNKNLIIKTPLRERCSVYKRTINKIKEILFSKTILQNNVIQHQRYSYVRKLSESVIN